ncbi:MAG: hypothetical protein AABY51_02075 [Deltaproteobacteria bacterium]
MIEITGSKKKLVIVAFVVIWVALIFYNLPYFSGAKRVRLDEKSFQAPLANANTLRSASFEVQTREYPGVIKNLFSPNTGNSFGSTISRASVKAQPNSVIEATRPEPQVIPSDLKLFTGRLRIAGMLKKHQDKIVFAYRGNDVIFMRKGDLLEGKFVVSEISDESIVITSLADNETSKLIIPK